MCKFTIKHEVNKNLQVSTSSGKYSEDNKNRSILTVAWESKYTKTAIAIGINPSKANDSRSDKTLTTLARFLDAYGYKEFKMLNLFESYSTEQSGIDKKTKTNFREYSSDLESADSIFIVWGVSNNYQEEKEMALGVLQEYHSKLLCLQNDNGSKPIHPSRMSYQNKIVLYKM